MDGGPGKGGDLDPLHFGDGPPYSEDEDLASPIVSSRHRKHKSTSATMGHGKSREMREGRGNTPSFLSQETYNQDRGYYVGTSGDGSERYYINQGEEANGPGGEYVTYPTGSARQSTFQSMDHPQRQYPDESEYRSESDASDTASSPGFNNYDESRYSRDYQFTITSPDEEMHGKAVALFDFERENENELPLVEGQIIWVSYRHGQGWLVAEDPKTQESGLVPEEYVRLLRDIEGGMTSLTGHLNDGLASPNDAGTPTQAEPNNNSNQAVSTTQSSSTPSGHAQSASMPTNGYHQPIVSVFSTSSKDLDPYPQYLLGMQSGHPPPQVVHYHGQRGGSQANTPTAKESFENGLGRRTSQDAKRNSSASRKSQKLETLPHTRMKTPMTEPEGDTQGEEQGRESGEEHLAR
ncbi:HOG (high osmolarity glycerol) pathway protein [Diatrype stigma]|uniref:HOG (High osmolarity glycerol) pathway protein n=1 Tax=Diatrype stigma TaxID=117547 RepID=A0AAN9UWY3_9PEZI